MLQYSQILLNPCFVHYIKYQWLFPSFDTRSSPVSREAEVDQANETPWHLLPWQACTEYYVGLRRLRVSGRAPVPVISTVGTSSRPSSLP
jgi:hypothetical protein